MDGSQDGSRDFGIAWDNFFNLVRMGASFSGRERNRAFLNTRDGRFSNISIGSGFDFPDDGRAVTLVDWDHDGDLDVWVSNRNAPRLRLLLNNSPRTARSLRLQLVGDGTTTNRDAIGARVELRLAAADGQAAAPLAQTLRAGGGYLAQNSKWLHFGLGGADRVENVSVRWPSGDREEFGPAAAGKRYLLRQGSGQATEVDATARAVELAPAKQDVPDASSRGAVRFMTAVTLPQLTAATWEGREQPLVVGGGRARLINLWASWCTPCLKELKELASHHDELSAAGIEVVALAVDGVGGDTSDPQNAKAFAERSALPFTTRRATQATLDRLQLVHNQHTSMHFRLPLPCSFLVDADGRLIALYKGPTTADHIMEDVKKSATPLEERFSWSSLLGGRVLMQPAAEDALKAAEGEKRLRLAQFLRRSGLIAQAVEQYQAVIELWPECGMAYRDLGNIMAQQRRPREAVALWTKAVQFDPNLVDAQMNLGAVYMNQGRGREALAHFEKAHELEPDDAEILNNLGVAQTAVGQYAEAIRNFERALEINDRDPRAHGNLARLLATCADAQYRDGQRALEHAKRANQLLAWRDVAALVDLAAAHAELGQFEEAIKRQTQAIGLAPPRAQPRLRSYLELYESGQPLRPPRPQDADSEPPQDADSEPPQDGDSEPPQEN
ncbi:MAG: tetratricopeptide repeat protein [Planctomycetota bacterium]|nr:MAG: tetratricopeptide repeat protein [Planctomycetota bacterium]